MSREGSSNGARDGLEITAIGTLYKGAWDKKYWSCSRGKDRYPYPVGYQAVRNHAGHIYKMEIREGTKGPAFVVISEEGISCLGETPTIAWEKIQKKKNMRVQKWHRNQFSRVDGAELFGFTNPLVQRLFRELMTNENGTAEKSDRIIHQSGKNLKLDIGKAVKDYGKGIDSTAEPLRAAGRKRGRRTSHSELAEKIATSSVRAKSDLSMKDANFCSSCQEENKGNTLKHESSGGTSNSIHSDNCLTYSRRRNRSAKQEFKESIAAFLDVKKDKIESTPLSSSDIEVLTKKSSGNSVNETNGGLQFLLSDGCVSTKANISNMTDIELENANQSYSFPVSGPENMIFSKHHSEHVVSRESGPSILTASEFTEAIQNLQPPAVTTEGSTRKKRLKLDKRKAIHRACLEFPKGDVDFGIPAMAIEKDETGMCVLDTLDLVEENKSLNLVYMSENANHTLGISIKKEDSASVPVGNSLAMVSDPSCHLRQMESSSAEHMETLQACINPGMDIHNTLAAINHGNGTGVGSHRELDGRNLQTDSILDSSVRDDKEALLEVKTNEEILVGDKANQFGMETAVIPLEVDPKFAENDQSHFKDSDSNPSQQMRQFTVSQSQGDSDSMGQELAKSMMTVLLPQALPLLKQTAKKKRKNMSEQDMRVSSLGDIQSYNARHAARKKTEKPHSSDMHVVFDLDICETELAAKGDCLLVGRSFTDNTLGLGAEVVSAEPSVAFSLRPPEAETPENSCVPGPTEKTMPSETVCPSINIELINSVRGISHTDNIDKGLPPTKVPDEGMPPPMQAINVQHMSKLENTVLGDVDIGQELCITTFDETADEVNAIHAVDLLCVHFNGKETCEGRGEATISTFVGQTGNSRGKCFLKPAQVVGEGLEMDVPSGSKSHASSGDKDDQFDSSKQDDKNDPCIAKQDPVALECVVPDSFEDEQCSNDNVKRESCHFGALVTYKLPLGSYEGHSPPIANTEVDAEALATYAMNLEAIELVENFGGISNHLVDPGKITKSVTAFPSKPEVLSTCLSKEGNGNNTLRSVKLEYAFSEHSSEEIMNHVLHEQECSFSSCDGIYKDVCFHVQPTVAVEQLSHCHDAGKQGKGLRRMNASFFSGTYDVKENPTMVNIMDHIHIKGVNRDGGIGNSFNIKETTLKEFCPGKNERCEPVSALDPEIMTKFSDCRQSKQVQFEDSWCALPIPQREEDMKHDLPGKDHNIPCYEECFEDKKGYNVDSDYKMGQSSDLSEHFYSGGQPGSRKTSISHQMEDNGAYSTGKQLLKNLSRHSQVNVSEDSIHVFAPCCQLTSESGIHSAAVEHHISSEKESIVKQSETRTSGHLGDKEVSHEISASCAEGKLAVPQLLLERAEQTPHVSEGHFQDLWCQNAGKLSERKHMVLPSVSASDLDSGMLNRHRIHNLQDAIAEGENLHWSDKEVGVASSLQSMQAKTSNKNSKGIQAVLTFSDVPPCTSKSIITPDCKVIEGDPLLNKELDVSNLDPGLPTQVDAMLDIHQSTNVNNNSLESPKLVGCYEHPIPVLSMLLSVQGKDVHLCVVCGLSEERERNLFIYKVVTRQAEGDYSYLLGYTVVVLPDVEDCFDVKPAFDRSGIQLTPDGQNLILLESIEIQNLGKPRVNCVHSHGQCEGHGVKLVSVQNEHVSVVTRLNSVEIMYCILVCASQYIVAAGENGCLQVWNMDLKWSMCVEEFTLPSASCTTSILELVAVPHFSHLIIGRNCNGCYAMWDISRRLLLSIFRSVDYNIFETVVLEIVSQDRGDETSKNFTDCKLPNQISHRKGFNDNMVSRDTEELRTSKNNLTYPHLEFNEGNMAVCLLVLAAPHPDQIQRNQDEYCDEEKQIGLWRLALLENNVLLMGSVLDARASVASVFSQSGMIGTSEGHIYAWEAMSGKKLFTLRDVEGVSITCISADPKSTAFAVARNDHRVFLYVHETEP